MGTIRQDLIDLLKERALDAKDISRLLSIREKEVYSHLEHISRSISTSGHRLVVIPCQCLACGYTFKDRKKLHRPGKCPKCKKTRIKPASYTIR
ncbi:MAG: transcriptional regulator [Thermodesulfobacteriota bacterium]